jgi:hypothetical protein
MSIIDFIHRYESEPMPTNDVINGFAILIEAGVIGSLQGSYGRTAHALMSAGYIDTDGKVLAYPDQLEDAND